MGFFYREIYFDYEYNQVFIFVVKMETSLLEANAGKNRGVIDFLQRIALPTGGVARKSKKIFCATYYIAQKIFFDF